MSSDRDKPIGRIVRGVLLLSRRMRAERMPSSASPSGIALLGTLYRFGSLPAWRLAIEERLQPQSLTRVIASLEKEQLIVRSRSDRDRRELEIAMTPKGLAVLSADMGSRRAWLEKAMAKSLNASERHTLTEAADIMLRLATIDFGEDDGGEVPD